MGRIFKRITSFICSLAIVILSLTPPVFAVGGIVGNVVDGAQTFFEWTYNLQKDFSLGFWKTIFGEDFNSASEEELKAAYDDYVATLPATGYQSDGSLLWSPKISYVGLAYQNSWVASKYYYCPHYSGDQENSLAISPTFNCSNNSFSIRPVAGSESFLANKFVIYFSDVYPIDGYYSKVFSPAISGSYVSTYNNKTSTNSFEYAYSADNKFILHYAGISYSSSETLTLNANQELNSREQRAAEMRPKT